MKINHLVFILFIFCGCKTQKMIESSNSLEKNQCDSVVNISIGKLNYDTLTVNIKSFSPIIRLDTIEKNEYKSNNLNKFDIIKDNNNNIFLINTENGECKFLVKNDNIFKWQPINKTKSINDIRLENKSNYKIILPEITASPLLLLNINSGTTWYLIKKENRFSFELIRE
jgi:hypothetical protein